MMQKILTFVLIAGFGSGCTAYHFHRYQAGYKAGYALDSSVEGGQDISIYWRGFLHGFTRAHHEHPDQEGSTATPGQL